MLNPTLEPRPRFLLHLQVEFVRGIIEAAFLALGCLRFRVAAPDFLECGPDSFGSEQTVLRSVDHKHGARSDQGRQIRHIEVAIESDYMEGKTDGVDDVPLELSSE